jgi:hypothetical protein
METHGIVARRTHLLAALLLQAGSLDWKADCDRDYARTWGRAPRDAGKFR